MCKCLALFGRGAATTLATLVVAALASGLADWPRQGGWSLSLTAAAQQPPRAAPEKGEAKPKSREDASAKAEAALATRVAAEFIETPLRDVLVYLSDLTGLQFHVQWRELESSGIAQDAPITLRLKSVRVEMLLDLVLAQVQGVTHALRDGVVVVSTAEVIENTAEVRVYDCRDLLKAATPASPRPVEAAGVLGRFGVPAPGFGGGPPGAAPGPGAPGGLGPGAHVPGVGLGGGPLPSPTPAETLIGVITTTVVPTSWEEAGGLGAISEYGGLLVVNHNARTHRQIEKVLTMLREALVKDPVGNAPDRPGERPH